MQQTAALTFSSSILTVNKRSFRAQYTTLRTCNDMSDMNKLKQILGCFVLVLSRVVLVLSRVTLVLCRVALVSPRVVLVLSCVVSCCTRVAWRCTRVVLSRVVSCFYSVAF